MELDMQTIGLRIKTRRKYLKLTQNDIKAVTSISSGNLSEIENGNRTPSASTLLQLAGVLNCSVDWILTGLSSTEENPDEQELKLLELFRQLNPAQREEIFGYMQFKLQK